MSILSRINTIISEKNKTKAAEEVASKKQAITHEEFKTRLYKSIRETISELNGSKSKFGPLIINNIPSSTYEICSMTGTALKGYSSQWLLSVEFAWWTVEGEEGGYGIKCEGIKIDYYSTHRHDDESSKCSKYISFSDYTFNEDLKKFEDWLVSYMTDII